MTSEPRESVLESPYLGMRHDDMTLGTKKPGIENKLMSSLTYAMMIPLWIGLSPRRAISPGMKGAITV